MNKNKSLRWIAVITAEKVEESRRILELGETATERDITGQFRALAKRWHPDVCRDKDPLICNDRIRKITNAKNLLMRLVRDYRYSLQKGIIQLDQEDYDMRIIRLYGDTIGDGSTTEINLAEIVSKKDRNRITAENVILASSLLGLSDIASKWQIESAYNRRKQQTDRISMSPNCSSSGHSDIHWAHNFLIKYIEQYRYSFRPDDIRNYQEDAIERHRRQFGNEPMWAGGEYDDK